MGLFRKSNPAEKKLKELTGGFLLSTSFMQILKEHNLEIEDGTNIKNQLKDEIKQGKLNENNVQTRLNQLIKQYSNSSANLKRCPECGEFQDVDNTFCINCGNNFSEIQLSDNQVSCPICSEKQEKSNRYCINCGYDFKTGKVRETVNNEYEFEDFRRKTQFLNNYDFNMKICPDCNTKFLKSDPFCFNCGASVVTHGTVMNDSVEFKNGKLVQKDEVQNDELSDLEALYNQTVKSKYAPLFKIAYVLYLDSFDKNPSKQSVDKLAKNYDTTHNKLKMQALEDEFIELAPAISQAHKTKVADLKEILKEHGLKVSGKKDELIERLNENLSEDELKKYFKSKNYQISSKGEEFLAKNAPILYVHNSKELGRVLLAYDLDKIFEQKLYSQDEMYDMLLNYLKRILDEKLNNNRWIDFKSTSNAIAKVQEDKGDLEDALKTRLQVFLFDINNYSHYSDKPEPGKTKLKKKDMAPLVSLMHEMTLPIDELKNLFEKVYNETLFKTVITSQDSLIYLLKVFGGEDLDSISKDINENYANLY